MVKEPSPTEEHEELPWERKAAEIESRVGPLPKWVNNIFTDPGITAARG